MNLFRCYTRDELKDFILGKLNTETSAAISEHLDQCNDCEDTIVSLEHTVDDLLDVLSKAKDDHDLAPPIYENNPDYNRAFSVAQGISSSPEIWTDEADPISPTRIGDYEIVSTLARGGMGSVFKARHTRLEKEVAIKILPERKMQSPDAIARFSREMRIIGKMSHPCMVAATDAGTLNGIHYLVMELVDGIDLGKIVRRCGSLGIAEACELVRQAALGIQYAHDEGVIHRDVKPSNLMLTEDSIVKVLDLGLATLGGLTGTVDELTTVGQLMGTLDYMAPEQCGNSNEVDGRTDIYGLGATLYKLLAGVAPYSSPENDTPLKKLKAMAISQPIPIVNRLKNVPRELVDIINRCLAREPGDRFETATELANALKPFSEGHQLPDVLKRARPMETGEDTKINEPRDSQLVKTNQSLAKKKKNHTIPVPPVKQTGSGRAGRFFRAAILLAGFGFAGWAGIVLYLNTTSGQLIIESEVDDIRVTVLKNEKPTEDLQIEHGAKSTRLRAGKYRVVIKGDSDSLTIENDQFLLKRGETVVARITRKELGKTKAVGLESEVADPDELLIAQPLGRDFYDKRIYDLQMKIATFGEHLTEKDHPAIVQLQELVADTQRKIDIGQQGDDYYENQLFELLLDRAQQLENSNSFSLKRVDAKIAAHREFIKEKERQRNTDLSPPPGTDDILVLDITKNEPVEIVTGASKTISFGIRVREIRILDQTIVSVQTSSHNLILTGLQPGTTKAVLSGDFSGSKSVEVIVRPREPAIAPVTSTEFDFPTYMGKSIGAWIETNLTSDVKLGRNPYVANIRRLQPALKEGQAEEIARAFIAKYDKELAVPFHAKLVTSLAPLCKKEKAFEIVFEHALNIIVNDERESTTYFGYPASPDSAFLSLEFENPLGIQRKMLQLIDSNNTRHRALAAAWAYEHVSIKGNSILPSSWSDALLRRLNDEQTTRLNACRVLALQFGDRPEVIDAFYKIMETGQIDEILAACIEPLLVGRPDNRNVAAKMMELVEAGFVTTGDVVQQATKTAAAGDERLQDEIKIVLSLPNWGLKQVAKDQSERGRGGGAALQSSDERGIHTMRQSLIRQLGNLAGEGKVYLPALHKQFGMSFTGLPATSKNKLFDETNGAIASITQVPVQSLYRGYNFDQWLIRFPEADSELAKLNALKGIVALQNYSNSPREIILTVVPELRGISFDYVDFDNQESIQTVALSLFTAPNRQRQIHNTTAFINILDELEDADAMFALWAVYLSNNPRYDSVGAFVRNYLDAENPLLRRRAIYVWVRSDNASDEKERYDILSKAMLSNDLDEDAKLAILQLFSSRYGVKGVELTTRDPRRIAAVLRFGTARGAGSQLGYRLVLGLLAENSDMLDAVHQPVELDLWGGNTSKKRQQDAVSTTLTLFDQILDFLDDGFSDHNLRSARTHSQKSVPDKQMKKAILNLKQRYDNSTGGKKRKLERVIEQLDPEWDKS